MLRLYLRTIIFFSRPNFRRFVEEKLEQVGFDRIHSPVPIERVNPLDNK
jgi:hypothetical protein